MNFRYALRSLRKNPLLTGIAIVSLGLGIGANTAIFSLIDQLLLRLLPVDNPQQLVQLATRGPLFGASWGDDRLSYPMYRDFRDRNAVFSGVLAYYATPISLGYGGRTERLRSELVTGDYFQVLGVPAAIGRTFTPEDNQTLGGEPVAVLSYDFWISRFGRDRNIVGATIHLNGQPMTVIGVSAPGFRGIEIGDATQVFVPMMMQSQMNPVMGQFSNLENRRSQWVGVFARLKADVTMKQAQASLGPIYRQIIEVEVQAPEFARIPESGRQQFLTSRLEVLNGSTGRSALRSRFTKPLYVLMAISGFVLLIACANIASLLIARATARQKEIAVRLALGASRTQIVVQLMIESLLLSALAAIFGVGLGVWIDRMLLRFLPADNAPLTISAALDIRVLLFSLVVGFVTAFLFGLVPALQSTRPYLSETLKNEAGSIFGSRSHARMRKSLVVAQVSVSLLLLIASSLFVRSLANLHQLNPGFRTDRVIAFSIDPTLNGYDQQRTTLFYRDMLDRVRALPGVEAAGHAVVRVLDSGAWRNILRVEGYTPPQGERVVAHFNAVSPGYFDTLGIRLIAGRDFSAGDTNDRPRVCIVNEGFASKYFPDGLAVGRHIGQSPDPTARPDIEIIGVVSDAKYENLRDAAPRQVYIPFFQNQAVVGTVVYVRTSEESSAFLGTVRSKVQEMDPALPLFGIRSLEDQVDRSLMTERMIATLASAFGTLATLLAMIGMYGVMSFTVARRAKEIGIRMSLGAQTRNVLGMMMREVAFLMVSGIAIAIPAYIALARYIRSQLYGIEAGDPVNIAAAALFLLAIGLTAGYIPSRRALRVDPIRSLRYE
jgi:putative ABC transport system permease protein